MEPVGITYACTSVGGAEQEQNNGDGPLGNHAARNVALMRYLRLLRSRFGYAGLLLIHNKPIVSETVTIPPIVCYPVRA